MASVYKQNGITIDVTEVEKLLAKFGDITPNLMRKSLRRGFAAIGKDLKAIQKSQIKAIAGKRKAGICQRKDEPAVTHAMAIEHIAAHGHLHARMTGMNINHRHAKPLRCLVLRIHMLGSGLCE